MGAPLDLVTVGEFSFDGLKLRKFARKYAAESTRPHKSWMVGAEERRPSAEVIRAADLTAPIILGQLLTKEGSVWIVLDGLPQLLKAQAAGESIPVIRLSIDHTTRVLVSTPKPADDQQPRRPSPRYLLRDRQRSANGQMGDFD